MRYKISITESRNYQNEVWLREQYLISKKRIKDIAKENNITTKTVHFWLNRFKIPKRKPTVGNFSKHPTGENHPNWKGDKVSYYNLHLWVSRHKSKPEKCEICGEKKQYLELANISGEYKRDLNDYKYMCIVCHKKHDGIYEKFLESGKATRFKKGHHNEMRWGKLKFVP